MAGQWKAVIVVVMCISVLHCQKQDVINGKPITKPAVVDNKPKDCSAVTCPKGEYCRQGVCVSDTVNPCKYVKCTGKKHCENGLCVPNEPDCQTLGCSFGQHCEDTRCVSDYDPCRYMVCHKPDICVNGICQSATPQYCRINSDCKFPKRCLLGVCKQW